MTTDAPLEQDVIRISQRLFLAQAALDTLELFSAKFLKLTPRAAGAGEFLYHLLAGLESSAAAAQGRRAIPGLHSCEQNHGVFLAAPAGTIRERLLFASHVLCQFAVHAGAMDAGDAKELEGRNQAALQNVAAGRSD